MQKNLYLKDSIMLLFPLMTVVAKDGSYFYATLSM